MIIKPFFSEKSSEGDIPLFTRDRLGGGGGELECLVSTFSLT
jgi:hypothetical protein